ncbi:MAG: NUDIX domain-containing protein [Candidatus Sedimenticola sp. 20ELBAFRAG]
MAKVHSAGVLLYKFSDSGELLLFLAHPGGPYWAKKDEFSWSIPKGLVEENENDYVAVAKREFKEEIGSEIEVELQELGAFKQPSGKVVHAWYGEQDINPDTVESNLFELEWPPKSGNTQSFPEIDRANWFNYPTAKKKILKGQLLIIDTLVDILGYNPEKDRESSGDGQFSLF